jgi:ADP-L-glycero-D-manno-heptose 6-epimerase
MIILTGSSGFIGKNFLKKLSKKEDIILVEKDNTYTFYRDFNDWNKVSLILHQGAISSTTETNLYKLWTYNVEFSCALFDKAIEYKIPVKYASSASVYGNTQGEINPLNQYAISKLQIDYNVLDNLDKFSFIQGFRYFNVYGNGEEHKGSQASPVSKFIKEVRETGRLNLFEGSERFLRDIKISESLNK